MFLVPDACSTVGLACVGRGCCGPFLNLGVAIFDVAGGFTHLCVQLLFISLCGFNLEVDGAPVLEEVAADYSSILELPSSMSLVGSL